MDKESNLGCRLPAALSFFVTTSEKPFDFKTLMCKNQYKEYVLNKGGVDNNV